MAQNIGLVALLLKLMVHANFDLVQTHSGCEVSYKYDKLWDGNIYRLILKDDGSEQDVLQPIREGSKYLYSSMLTQTAHNDIVGHNPNHNVPSTYYKQGKKIDGLCRELGLSPVIIKSLREFKELNESLHELNNRSWAIGKPYLHYMYTNGIPFPLGAVKNSETAQPTLVDPAGDLPFQMFDFKNTYYSTANWEYGNRYFLIMFCYYREHYWHSSVNWTCSFDWASESTPMIPLCMYNDKSHCFNHTIVKDESLKAIGASQNRLYYWAEKQSTFEDAVKNCAAIRAKLLDFPMEDEEEEGEEEAESKFIFDLIHRYHLEIEEGNGDIFTYTSIKLDKMDADTYNYERPFTWISNNERWNWTDVSPMLQWDSNYRYEDFMNYDHKQYHLQDCAVISKTPKTLRPVHCKMPAYYICYKEIRQQNKDELCKETLTMGCKCKVRYRFDYTSAGPRRLILNNAGALRDTLVPIQEGSRYLYSKHFMTTGHNDVVGHNPDHKVPSVYYKSQKIDGLCKQLGLSPVIISTIEEFKNLNESLYKLNQQLWQSGKPYLTNTVSGTRRDFAFPLGAVKNPETAQPTLVDPAGNLPFQMFDYENTFIYKGAYGYEFRHFLIQQCRLEGYWYDLKWKCSFDWSNEWFELLIFCMYKENSTCYKQENRNGPSSKLFELGTSSNRLYYGSRYQATFDVASNTCSSKKAKLLDFSKLNPNETLSALDFIERYHNIVAHGHGSIFTYTSIKLDKMEPMAYIVDRPFTWQTNSERWNWSDVTPILEWDYAYYYDDIMEPKYLPYQHHDCAVISRTRRTLRPVHCLMPAYFICYRELSAFPWLNGNITYKRDESLECECGIKNELTGRITGGTFSTPYEFPWMVLIYPRFPKSLNLDKDKRMCGGSVINNRMILTSASCVLMDKMAVKAKNVNEAMAKEYTLYLHTYSRVDEELSERFTSKTVLLNEDFKEHLEDPTYFDYDLALLVLDSPLDFSWRSEIGTAIRPICLPKIDNEIDPVGQISTFAGWGALDRVENSQATYSNVLRKYDAPIAPLEECKVWKNHMKNEKPVTDKFICQANQTIQPGKGDSGGPLIVQQKVGKWTQVGIYSWHTEVYDKRVDTDTTVDFGYNKGRISLYTDVQKQLQFIEYHASRLEVKWCKT